MRINSSYIGMESERRFTAVRANSVRLTYGRFLNGNSGQTSLGQLFNTDVTDKESETSKKKTTGLSAGSLQERFESLSGVKRMSERDISSALDKIREQCFRFIYELLFGGRERSKTGSASEEKQSFEDWMQNTAGGTGAWQEAGTGIAVETVGYMAEFTYSEQETTSFSTVGTVKTADGREINFNLDVEMSRSFTRHYVEEYQQTSVRVCDPLVINLDTDIANLSDQKFFFDIDADGTEDEISMLASGSGYLALDKNGDGQINDGSELFGTQNGDGFKDLARYDEDGNGWIDENDSVWNKLQIWCRDEAGNDVLYRLADKGVGAICLEKAGTQYSLNSRSTNQTNGYIRSTGVFLYESGLAGTIQHVDVATGFDNAG